eukprot:6178810-Pleurochrysis_carterae.AAC.2
MDHVKSPEVSGRHVAARDQKKSPNASLKHSVHKQCTHVLASSEYMQKPIALVKRAYYGSRQPLSQTPA